MKIVITGAHFTPAVAVIEQLKKYKAVEIVYVGRKTTFEGDSSPSIESKVLPALGVKFIPIITGRLQRTFTLYTIPSLLKIPIGFIQAVFILSKEKPDVILSLGGYVALPAIIVGWLFSIPIILHEGTLVTGLTHKISSLLASKKVNCAILRQEIIAASKIKYVPSARAKILIAGGNQGSHAINLALEQVLDKLQKNYALIHQTGVSRFGDYERLVLRENENYQVEKFIDKKWGEVLARCDLLISRAGINTLTEAAFLGKRVLVIPIEGHDEQKQNARFFARLGVAEILPQTHLTGDNLLKKIGLMLKEKKVKSGLKINPDGAKRLALEIKLLAEHE